MFHVLYDPLNHHYEMKTSQDRHFEQQHLSCSAPRQSQAVLARECPSDTAGEKIWKHGVHQPLADKEALGQMHKRCKVVILTINSLFCSVGYHGCEMPSRTAAA